MPRCSSASVCCNYALLFQLNSHHQADVCVNASSWILIRISWRVGMHISSPFTILYFLGFWSDRTSFYLFMFYRYLRSLFSLKLLNWLTRFKMVLQYFSLWMMIFWVQLICCCDHLENPNCVHSCRNICSRSASIRLNPTLMG